MVLNANRNEINMWKIMQRKPLPDDDSPIYSRFYSIPRAGEEKSGIRMFGIGQKDSSIVSRFGEVFGLDGL